MKLPLRCSHPPGPSEEPPQPGEAPRRRAAAAITQKPISRQELYESLSALELLPLAHRQALRVLVVDNDPKAVERVAVRLRGLASTLLRAHDGRAAIEVARKELPHLIVLDLMMPVRG